jgi:acyl-CoA synthetase (AMP-forming)/AMP-acid ligase II
MTERKMTPRFLNRVKAEIIDPIGNSVLSPAGFIQLVRSEVHRLSSTPFFPNQYRGCRILLDAQNNVRFLVRIFAIWELGGIAIPFDSKITAIEKDRLMESSEPHYQYLSDSDAPVKVSRLKPSERLFELPVDVCLLLLTSGTTGFPKVVMHGYSNLDARFENGRKAISSEDRKSCLNVLPLHFAHGLIGVVLQALFDSERLVLMPPELGSSGLVTNIGEWIDKYQVTFLSATPASWVLILRMCAPPRGSSLRRAQLASAHATTSLHEKIKAWTGAPLYNCYGTTETATWISDRLLDAGIEPRNVGSGKSWNSDFRIHDPDEQGIGEIVVCTKSRSLGYLHEWQPNRKLETEYRTGDRGKLNSLGEVILIGRESRLINRGGLKVSPEEIESEILGLGLVEDVAVFGRSALSGEQAVIDSIVGIVVLKRETTSPVGIPTALVKGLASRISPQKIPSEWLIWDSIPRLPNGKLNLNSIKTKFQKTP